MPARTATAIPFVTALTTALVSALPASAAPFEVKHGHWSVMSASPVACMALKTEKPTIRKSTKLIHEGKYAAEVDVDLHYNDESWSPTLSLSDVQKLEITMLALRAGDIATASKHGRVFELKPVAAE